MKKIFAILMTLAILSLCSVSAFAAPATADGTVYDLVANFADLSDTCFSFGARAKADGTMYTTSTFHDGTDDAIKSATHEKAMVGYRVNDIGGARVDVFYSADDTAKVIKWYPNSAYENVIIFTAPVAGTYSYNFHTTGIWDFAHTSTRYYVEAAGEIKNEILCPKGTGKDVPTAMTGTVTLKAGDTIYLVYDPEDSASGDNSKLNAATVTLVEASAAPATSDAAVSIAVAIATAAIVGLAVVVKKH